MTEYDWLSLDEDEEVVWSGQPRIKSILPAVGTGIIFLPVFGLGLLIIVGAYLSVKNTDFVVTSKGIYRKSGVLSRDVQKIGFDKVQNISFSQGMLGNYFGYGNVDISTAGGSGVEMRFRSIEDPKSIQQLINKHTEKRQEKTDTGDQDVMNQILEELKKIRKSVETIEENHS